MSGNLEALAKERQTAARAFYGLFSQPWLKFIQTVFLWFLDFRWEANSKVHWKTTRSGVVSLHRTRHGCDGILSASILLDSWDGRLLMSWLHASAWSFTSGTQRPDTN
jgi:hypothetical protein